MILSIQNKKKVVIAASIVAFLILASAGIYFYLFKNQKPVQQNQSEIKVTHAPCLGDDEIANYELNKKGMIGADVIISIVDKTDNTIIYSFSISEIFKNYHPIELHRCGVYVMKMFNYDVDKIKQEEGSRMELWKYDYSGKGESLLLLAEKPKEFISYYDLDFRVDPMEVYIALVQSYSEIPENIGYVFKNQQTRKDSFTLLYPTILKINPDLDGYLGLKTWTKSGSYFWGDISAGAPRLSFVRIKRDSWEHDVLPAPGGTLGGTAFNPEYGYITYDTGPGWIGIDVIAEQVYDEWRKEGKKIDFYVYNLFTKEKTLLATIDDPSWSFKPKWISDTELEYELPTGEKKVYKINIESTTSGTNIE